jgi:hypothetical protein
MAGGTVKSYLLQNVNTYVFKNPVQVMENIDKVTEHIRKKCPGQTTLHFHHTAQRKTYLEDGANFWRMTNYIPSTTYNVVKDMDVVRKFALQIPVSRFLVNTPGALGGIGSTTGLFPALTLGCGAVGSSSSSNNISPLDLINIRRVAWGQKQTQSTPVPPDDKLIEYLTTKILERLK